jgi:ComF family protein
MLRRRFRVAALMQRLGWLTRPAVELSTRLRRAAPAACGRFIDLLYPPQCSWCKADISEPSDGIALCDDCRRQIAPPVANWCHRCSAAIFYVAEVGEDCIYCRGQQFHWQRVVAMGNYRGELRKAIWATKHPPGESLAQSLAKLLLERRVDALRELNAEVVVPITMHWRRRLQRGTNGPEIMAAVLAGSLRLPLAAGVLRRSKFTALQAESTLRQRKINQRGSFRVKSVRRVKGRRVLLVDDVLTTGATSNAATKALLAAGAASVVVATIARAVGDDAL